jgi:thioredoxin reductase (NADPH)
LQSDLSLNASLDPIGLRMDAANSSLEETRNDEIAFPILNAAEILAAEKFGQHEWFETGRVLFEPGQQLADFRIIVDGQLEVVDTSGDQERVMAVHGTGGFVGDISLLTHRPAISLCRVKSAAELIRVPLDAFRRLLISSPSFAEKWMTALMRRREMIVARGMHGLRVFGGHADVATLRLCEFLHRNGVPHRWIESTLTTERTPRS